jgi:exodeoxyribonuclease VIII
LDLLTSSREPGKCKLDDATYHADPAISSTQLVEACRSPAHFWQISTMNPGAEPREDTPDLILGRAIHCRLLEPKDFHFRYRCAPDVDRRTKAGKQAYAEFEQFVAEQGATAITPDMRETIEGMAAALEQQELETTSGQIIKLADIFKHGEAEQAFFWKDAETGLMCRCKADWIIGSIVLDYKSTRDARLHQFRRQVGGLRYHMRAAFYLDGIEAVIGKRLTCH